MVPNTHGCKGTQPVQEAGFGYHEEEEVPRQRGRDRNVHHEVTDEEVDQLAERIEKVSMDPIVARFQSMHISMFLGTESGEKAEAWIKEMGYLFNLVDSSPPIRLNLAIFQLKELAQLWWEATHTVWLKQVPR